MLRQHLCRFTIVLAISWPAAAAGDHPPLKIDGKPPVLFPEKGRHHHSIATKNAEAQTWFDQGMTWYWGFNHVEAIRCFHQAALLDPDAAMPHWGIAIALGPNYNRAIDPVDAARNAAAYKSSRQALALSENAPACEQAYIKALTKRYSADSKADGAKLEAAYAEAMRGVMQAFPDDLDAATLYAEAVVNLRPWQLWEKGGKPVEGTEEALRVLEAVMERNPEHIGAIHYYIHAVEASPNPGRALAGARKLVELVPWAGHLVHMPAHIFIHTGDHEEGARCNELAARADEEFFRISGVKDGVYRFMYYPHNLHFIATARAAQGRFDEAKAGADKLAAFCSPMLNEMPMLEGFTLVPLQTLLRFHRWDEVLQLPEPDAKRVVSKTFWHFARATALAAKGRIDEAAKDQEAFEALRKQFPPEAMWAFNPVEKVLAVASEALQARLAKDPKESIGHWRKAVELEDGLAYGEPADWYYPVRESLGAALLRSGQAEEAEKVFREDLKDNRRNGRSLLGLCDCLKAQKKEADAAWVRQEFECAWPKGAPLRLEDF
jgi:tetratricopeptide (TPR) repeat protein